MTSAVVTEPTVATTAVLDAGSQRVGYVLFNSFIDTSNAALDQAFASFAEAGVTEVVIDERYNGGGSSPWPSTSPPSSPATPTPAARWPP